MYKSKKLNGTMSAETSRLQDEIDVLTTSMASLMPKPLFYTLSVSDTVTIGTTIDNATSLIFRKSNTVVNADSGYSGNLPDGVYTVSIQVNGDSSSQSGLY